MKRRTNIAFSYRWYIRDNLGSNCAIMDASGNLSNYKSYYPYGREMDMDPPVYGGIPFEGLSPAGNTFWFSGKEFVTQGNINWYDFGSRWYDPYKIRWTTPDPLAEKYYSISPYVYCAANPVNLVDPEGEDVKPKGDEELSMIRNTLPPEARQFVQLDENGLIDRDILKHYHGISWNYESLRTLVNTNVMTIVTLDNKFDYVDKMGKGGTHFMSYESADPDFMDTHFETAGVTTGESGFLGKALFPDRNGYENSPSDNMEIIINKSLSPLGAAETFSHEAYGHAVLYILTNKSHEAASHHFKGAVDTNRILIIRIITARKETVNNMK